MNPACMDPEPQVLTATVEMPGRQGKSTTDILENRDRVATATRSAVISKGRSRRVIKA